MQIRSACRTCGVKLKPCDPQRRQKVIYKGKVVSHVWRYLGECKQCASDRIVISKWKKRTVKSITKEIAKHEHNIEILRITMEDKQCKK